MSCCLTEVYDGIMSAHTIEPVSYTHLRAHETEADLVCRLLLEKKSPEKVPNEHFTLKSFTNHFKMYPLTQMF